MSIGKIIFRVDDRLIHGQVIEGWIKYLKLKNLILLNDRIAGDPLQKMIYSSIVPPECALTIIDKNSFTDDFLHKLTNKTMILVESVTDLYDLKNILNGEYYINVGCVASREHKIEITDTVFLDLNEIRMLSELREIYDIHIKKLPWETEVEIKNFLHLLEENG
ncbi:PTS sugar transporter subunit IIB [Deferribacteraceae bacterium V6Fe1]|nr:PTS sugar transporter subunit IIB [Deferribacteraceae bacterium V6Fe1]